MNLTEMVAAINRRIDDTISLADAVDFLNAGQNILAMEIGASFTQLLVVDPNGTFDFDAKWHEIPVIYACMRFKELDSVLTESNNYRAQFEEMKKRFVINYQIPMWQRDDRLVQQFVAQAGQKAFVITKDGYDPQQGDLSVYKNGIKLMAWERVISTITDEAAIITTLTTTNDPYGFIVTNACSLGDKITAVWEEHQDLVEPPYSFWAGQGW
jgi:hypothetical protein